MRQVESLEAPSQQVEPEQSSCHLQPFRGQEVHIPGNHLIHHVTKSLQHQACHTAPEHTVLLAAQPGNMETLLFIC